MDRERIDMNTYPRKAHFEYFCGMGYPYVGLTVNVDITMLVSRAKEERKSLFLYLLYAAGRAANSIPEFRQRIDGKGIVEYKNCKTSHTVMKPDGTYAYCEANPALPLDKFMEETKIKQDRVLQEGSIEEESDPQSLFFISCLPWISYTAMIQPVPNPADSNPRITWGGYFQQGDRLMLPVTVLVHHALVDGKQIADFYKELSAVLENY